MHWTNTAAWYRVGRRQRWPPLGHWQLRWISNKSNNNKTILITQTWPFDTSSARCSHGAQRRSPCLWPTDWLTGKQAGSMQACTDGWGEGHCVWPHWPLVQSINWLSVKSQNHRPTKDDIQINRRRRPGQAKMGWLLNDLSPLLFPVRFIPVDGTIQNDSLKNSKVEGNGKRNNARNLFVKICKSKWRKD